MSAQLPGAGPSRLGDLLDALRERGLDSGTRLLLRLRDGDADAFRAIYDKYHARLLGRCLAWTGCREDAEEVCQDTFLALHRVDPTSVQDLTGWLLGVARNRAVDLLRRTRRNRARPLPAGEPAAPQASGLDPETRELLRAGVAALPEDIRAVVDGHVFSGLTFDSLAARSGCSTPTAYRRFVRGTGRLRGWLRARGVSEDTITLVLGVVFGAAGGRTATAAHGPWRWMLARAGLGTVVACGLVLGMAAWVKSPPTLPVRTHLDQERVPTHLLQVLEGLSFSGYTIDSRTVGLDLVPRDPAERAEMQSGEEMLNERMSEARAKLSEVTGYAPPWGAVGPGPPWTVANWVRMDVTSIVEWSPGPRRLVLKVRLSAPYGVRTYPEYQGVERAVREDNIARLNGGVPGTPPADGGSPPTSVTVDAVLEVCGKEGTARVFPSMPDGTPAPGKDPHSDVGCLCTLAEYAVMFRLIMTDCGASE